VIGNRLAIRDWRPQDFGRRHVRQIDDPLIEPVWIGVRVLAHVASDRIEVIDEDGEPADGVPATDALQPAVRATSAVIDGYLTLQGIDRQPIIYNGYPTEQPTSTGFLRHMLLGGFGENRRERLQDLEERLAPTATGAIDPDAVFVAVDLLMLEGDPLLDVPLLERKRLLESVIDEGPLVRIGIHVRPPIGTWLETWRAAGFRSLAYKHANSRYRPGERNDDWALIRIPLRR
jgi:hypothetical protein